MSEYMEQIFQAERDFLGYNSDMKIFQNPPPPWPRAVDSEEKQQLDRVNAQVVVGLLSNMSAEARLDVLRSFCSHCGSFSHQCYCTWRS